MKTYWDEANLSNVVPLINKISDYDKLFPAT